MAKRVFGAATTRDVTELVERYFDLPCTSDLGLFDQVFTARRSMTSRLAEGLMKVRRA